MQQHPQLTRKLVYGGFKAISHWLAFRHHFNDPSLIIDAKYTEVMGLNFNNRFGIAAGFDRHGSAGRYLGYLGFGHVEIGTFTRRPQAGHNRGIDVLANRKLKKSTTILGINIGLNTDVTDKDITDDLKYCLRQAWAQADYITLNLTNPAAKTLLDPEHTDRLEQTLYQLKQQQLQLHQETGRYVPVTVKIALSSVEQRLPPIIKFVKELSYDGVILAIDSGKSISINMAGQWQKVEQQVRSCKLIQHVCNFLDGKVAVISVGGIRDHEHAQQRIDAGASLVQVHTGLVYNGPKFYGILSSKIAMKTEDVMLDCFKSNENTKNSKPVY